MFRGDHNSNTRQVLNRYINCVKNFYLKNKKTLNILLIVIFCVGFFGFVRYCFAETPASSSNISGWSMLKGPFISMLGYMASLIVQVCGWILTTTIGAVIDIAKYNDFVNNEQIKDAWIIIRDMCNMFFILILLVIAFATILRVETYNAKKLLPKLIIMAVLINFSRTICGLLIDASQLVMLTFVNAFTNATGNFVSLLKVQDFLKLVEDNNSWYKADTVDLNTAVGGLIIAVLFIIISTITLLAILIVFVVRMVMLWIYVVLSPFAFLLSSFPEGQKYAAQWWGEFIKYLINGPILAFFIWMALITMDKLPVKDFANTFAGASGSLEILTGGKFMHFIIAIGMLVGGLIVSSQIGGIGASWGANTVKGLSQKGIGFAKGGMKGAWKGTTGLAGFLNRKQALKTGIDLSPTRQIARVKAGLESMRKEDLRGIQAKSTSNLRRGGLIGGITGVTATDWTENYLKGFLGAKGWKQVFQGGKKSVNRLRGNQKLSSWKADNVSDEVGFNQKRRKLDIERYSAMKIGDKDTAREKEEEIQKLDKYKTELVSPLEGQRVALKDKYNKESLGFGEKADRLTIQDYEGKAESKAAIAEQGKKIDSTNEDELIADFQKAMSHNNVNLAAAIAKALVKCGGFNTLLGKHNYNPKAGLTESEIKQLKDTGRESEIKDKIGVNDFMRDIFQKRLGMNEHDSLTLQSDLGGLAESTSHAYLTKTVGVNPSGEFYQSKEAEREAAVNIEHRKKESEGWARKENRLYYGGENVYTKNFEWSKSGLTKVIDGLSIISKEITLKRFNHSSAKAFIEPGALEVLKKTIESAAASGVISNESFHKDLQGKNVGESINKFLQGLENYAKTLKKDNADVIREIVNKNIV